MYLISISIIAVTASMASCTKPKSTSQPAKNMRAFSSHLFTAGCARDKKIADKSASSVIKMQLTDSDSEKLKSVYGDWCKNKDESLPPRKDEVEECWNDAKIKDLRACLEKIIAPADPTKVSRFSWPNPDDMKKCGCNISGKDQQTDTQIGRNLYECEGAGREGLKVSPAVDRESGIANFGIMGMPPADNPGCMFDVGGNPPKPKPIQENCFACHSRSEPEGPSSEMCPDAPVSAPLE